VLIFLSGFFSGSETALTSITRFKVRLLVRKKVKGSWHLEELKKNPHRMLSTLLICNNIVNILATVIATNLALQIFKYHALAYATGILTLVILIIGEITPKSLATMYASRIAPILAIPIYYLGVFLLPIILFLDLITVKMFRMQPVLPKITEEDVKNIIDMAREEGGIDKDEKEMIHNIFEIDDIEVDEIMIPRTDMVAIEAESTVKDALKLAKATKLSRFPVFEDQLDKIVGILHIKDLLDNIKKPNTLVKTFMRIALFIPESKRIDDALRKFQKEKQQMGIIIDEHGGVCGLITLEDIVEEIVGEISELTDKEEQEITRTSTKTYSILGKADLGEVNKRLKIRLEEEGDYDTISGFILHYLKRFPKVGEVIELRNLNIKINSVKDNRIIEVQIKKT